MKVFITGITGQDGSYMADFLLSTYQDIEVYGGVRQLSVDNHTNIEHLIGDGRVTLVDFDLTDPHVIQSRISEIQPDYFINFAAVSFVGSSWDNPALAFNVNTMGVLHELEAIRKFSPHTKFYNAGSSEEWGNVDYSPQNESHPLKPRSPYGASKASARHLVKVYRESYGMFAIQGFLLNHESPRRGKKFVTKKIITESKRILAELGKENVVKPLRLGNIYSRRDWSHAKDFVRGVWSMLRNSAPKEYVLSSGETYSIKDFVDKTFKELGINGNWAGSGLEEIFVEKFTGQILVEIDEKFYRPAEVELLVGDSTLIKKNLGWVPNYNLDDLIKDMIDSN